MRHTPSPANSHNMNANAVALLVSATSPSHLPYDVETHHGGGGRVGGENVSRSGSPSPPQSGSQSPLHTLSFEDGRVLSQLPYEYSSFLDLPPSALGIYMYIVYVILIECKLLQYVCIDILAYIVYYTGTCIH